MAAFAAAVRSIPFAYMPVRDKACAPPILPRTTARKVTASGYPLCNTDSACDSPLYLCLLSSFRQRSDADLCKAEGLKSSPSVLAAKIEGCLLLRHPGCLSLLWPLRRVLARPGIPWCSRWSPSRLWWRWPCLLAPLPAVGLWESGGPFHQQFLADNTELLYWRFRHRQLMPG